MLKQYNGLKTKKDGIFFKVASFKRRKDHQKRPKKAISGIKVYNHKLQTSNSQRRLRINNYVRKSNLILPTSQKSLEQIALGRIVKIKRHLAYLNLSISNLKDRKQEVAKNSERGRLAKLRKVGVDHKILLEQEKGAFVPPIQEEIFQNHSTIPASQGLA